MKLILNVVFEFSSAFTERSWRDFWKRRNRPKETRRLFELFRSSIVLSQA